MEHDDGFLIALPYGPTTDWLRNILAKGSATVVTEGHAYAVDRPEVVSIRDATMHFRPKEQRMHRRFGVDTALWVRRVSS